MALPDIKLQASQNLNLSFSTTALSSRQAKFLPWVLYLRGVHFSLLWWCLFRQGESSKEPGFLWLFEPLPPPPTVLGIPIQAALSPPLPDVLPHNGPQGCKGRGHHQQWWTELRWAEFTLWPEVLLTQKEAQGGKKKGAV